MANLQLLPYAQQVAAIERQRKLANLLQEQGMQPSTTQMVSGIAVPTSPWESASKLAQNIASIYAQSKADEREAVAKKQAREEANKQIQGFVEGIGPQKAYTSTPVMEQSSDEDRTEMAPKMTFNDITGQYEPERKWSEITKPGMNRNQALAKLLEMKSSDNPYLADATSLLSGLMPKEATLEMGAIDPSKFTPASIKLAMQSNDPSLLEPITETKAPSYQRATKEWSDQSGNKWKQDYAFDPTTKKMESIGDKYLSDVYHAPGTSKDDDTKAGATLRAEFNNNPIVKRHQIVSSSYENILNNQETGAGDMALIFGYMKMLDSDSAVREGEYATAENSGSIPQSVRNYYNRAVSGERLQPEQRQAFIKQAKELYETSRGQVEVVRQGIEQIGKETGVNPRLYPLPEPKRRKPSANEPPPGFVPEPVSSTSSFGSPQNSLMFQFPSNR